MLNMESKTKLKPEEVRARLKAFFGPEGEGLQMEQPEGDCMSFCNNIGYVNATISEEDSKTVVNLVSREYEYQVKKFIGGLP